MRSPPLRHRTRSFPRRHQEVTDGGLMYWVISGSMLVRQRIVDIVEDRRDDGSACTGLVLDRSWCRYRPADQAIPGLALSASGRGPARPGAPAGEPGARMPCRRRCGTSYRCSVCCENPPCANLSRNIDNQISRLSLLFRLYCKPAPRNACCPRSQSRDLLAQTPVRPVRPRSAGRRLHRFARCGRLVERGASPSRTAITPLRTSRNRTIRRRTTPRTARHTTRRSLPRADRRLAARVRLEQRAQSCQDALRRRRAAADQQVDRHGRAGPACDGVAALEHPAVHRAVPTATTNFGSGIAVWARSSASTRLRVTGPVTSSTSACRGVETKRMPKRSSS